MPLIDLSQVTAPKVREAYRYWSDKRRDGRLPARADIDPIEIPRLLPYVVLSEVLRDPSDIRYRLTGTQVVQMNNLDLTGKRLNDGIHQPEWQDYWRRVYRDVVETGQPTFGADSYEYRDSSYAHFEWCLLPLAADGATVDMILEIEAFADRARPGEGLAHYMESPSRHG